MYEMRLWVWACSAVASSAVLLATPAAAATYVYSGHVSPTNSGAGNILNYIGKNSPMTFEFTTASPLAANMAFGSVLGIATSWEAAGGSAASAIDSNDTGAAMTVFQFSTDSLGAIVKYNVKVHATNSELPTKLWSYEFSNFDAGNVYDRAELDTLGLNHNPIDSALICTNACGRGASLGAFTRIDDPPLGGVPEPETWALMVLGFGGLGAFLRRNGERAANVA